MTNKSNPTVSEIHKECLNTGMYDVNLHSWFQLFKPEDLFLIDYDSFVSQPDQYLLELQSYFQLKNIVDYKEIIFNDDKSSYFCLKQDNDAECKNVMKKENLPEFNQKSVDFLKGFYKESNQKLKNMIMQFLSEFSLPVWLKS